MNSPVKGFPPRARMGRVPGSAPRNGCLELVSTGSKALFVSLIAGVIGLIVGGDELRGVAVAFFTVPVVFLFACVYFARANRSNALSGAARMRPGLRKSKGSPKAGNPTSSLRE